MAPLANAPFAVSSRSSFRLCSAPVRCHHLRLAIFGVYCAVITLAESLILQHAIIEYQADTGGFNGISRLLDYATVAYLLFILTISVGSLLVRGR